MEQELDGYGLIILIWLAVVYWQVRNSLRQPPQNDRRTPWDAGRDTGLTLSRQAMTVVPSQNGSDNDACWKGIAKPGSEVACGLLAIRRADHSFDAQHFLTGAAFAYEAIVSAFAGGDRAALQNLLSPDVYEAFAAAIAEREQRGEHMETSFVSVDKPQIVEANLCANSAQVTVRLISELVTATRAIGNAVVGGDPAKVLKVSEIWNFAREISSSRDDWKLDHHRHRLRSL